MRSTFFFFVLFPFVGSVCSSSTHKLEYVMWNYFINYARIWCWTKGIQIIVSVIIQLMLIKLNWNWKKMMFLHTATFQAYRHVHAKENQLNQRKQKRRRKRRSRAEQRTAMNTIALWMLAILSTFIVIAQSAQSAKSSYKLKAKLSKNVKWNKTIVTSFSFLWPERCWINCTHATHKFYTHTYTLDCS